MSESQKQELEEIEEIELKPFYHELKNEIVKPERVVVESRYFLEKWLPVLGPTLYAIVKVLRSMCYYNAETGEKRDYCFPSLQTIANKVGVSNDTIQRELNRPEAKEFVRKEPRYRFDVKLSKKVRTSNTYYVAMDDPLTPADQEKLRQMAQEKARELAEQKEKEAQKVQSLQALSPKPQIAVQVSTANCGSYSDRKMRMEGVPLREEQPTKEKIGWLSENQKGEVSPLNPLLAKSQKLLVKKGVKPEVAVALAKQHNPETVAEVIESVNESEGIRNHAGLIIKRLNLIATQEREEREAQEQFQQQEREREARERIERKKLEAQIEKEHAEFKEWLNSHPEGTYTQWVQETV